MKDKILIFISVVLLLVGLKIISSSSTTSNQVILGGETFVVEVADTDVLRSKGLSLHEPLMANEGMLFIFPREGNYGFWMKDMLFSIDIIWIDENLRITHIEPGVSPESYPSVFGATSTAKYVLEISTGESERLKIQRGDVVKFVKK